MSADPLSTVLARLPGCRRSGDGWSASCPAHGDEHASLSVSRRDDGSVLLKCHAGCSQTAVIEAMGLTFKNLFVNEKAELQITATYPYRDEQGTLLYEVARFEPKTFRQRRPDGAGGWTWSVNGVRRVVYRLPKLRGHQICYICEGEKDCDRL
jgi:putative DNA primase/helicase